MVEKHTQQWTEQAWLLNRFREAENVWDSAEFQSVILVVRQVLGGSVSDEEYHESFRQLPDWLVE